MGGHIRDAFRFRGQLQQAGRRYEPTEHTWRSTLRDTLTGLRNLWSAMPDIEFSVLVGSRAEGKARPESDWDIALQWKAGIDWMEILSKTETLRKKAADIAGVTPDLIELRRASLAVRANVAESGLPLSGEDTLGWVRFLTRTWRKLEDYYWEIRHSREGGNRVY